MPALTRHDVRRNDVRLSCLYGGDGAGVVVLLHGLAGSAAEMAPTAQALGSAYRVVVPDQRGHGHSTRRPADLSRAAHVADVVAVVDAFAGGAPVTLVGQSMGAHTALLVAAAHPDRVRRLVMLEGGVGGPGADDHPARIGAWFASWPVPFPDVAAAREFLGSTPVARAWAADLEARADGWWPRFDPGVLEAAIRGVAEVACWTQWQRVSAPTLLVTGANGTLEPAELTRMLASRPGVEHIIIPGAGHDAHLDCPGAWFAVLREFLDRR